jgi:tetratricopeptide (TPR) repeat protein
MSEAAWPVWQERDAQLRDVEAALAVGEDAIELHFRRANLLDETGRTEAAKQAYLAILHQAPTHAATLHLLGSLLNRTGYRRAARTVYGQAVACHPDDAQEHVTLANLLCEDGDAEAALPHFQAALKLGARSAKAHQGLGNAFERLGDAERAHFHWQCGFAERSIVELAYRGRGKPIRVLLLVAAGYGNVRFNLLLDDTMFSATVVASALTSGPLPPHDQIINAIGDADLCAVPHWRPPQLWLGSSRPR